MLLPRVDEEDSEGSTAHYNYLDDIIIYTKSTEEHLQTSTTGVPQTLGWQTSNEAEPTSLFAKEIQNLGHIWSTTGIKPLPLRNGSN